MQKYRHMLFANCDLLTLSNLLCLNNILYRVVIILLQRIHYQRFHCKLCTYRFVVIIGINLGLQPLLNVRMKC